jgi:hypothetical protein
MQDMIVMEPNFRALPVVDLRPAFRASVKTALAAE